MDSLTKIRDDRIVALRKLGRETENCALLDALAAYDQVRVERDSLRATLQMSMRREAGPHDEERLREALADALRVRAEKVEVERDEARSALGESYRGNRDLQAAQYLDVCSKLYDAQGALAAALATPTGQVRARVLREAAAAVEQWPEDAGGVAPATWLRALANEAEKKT